jgi:hypothetical protein
MNGTAVVLLGSPEAEMVTSLMVALRIGENVYWCSRAEFLISSTWLTESQLDHWPIWIIEEENRVEVPTFSL